MHHDKAYQALLTIPYIDNKLTDSLTTILNKYDLPIKLMVTPPPTLKNILVRNRIYDRICHDKTSCIICPSNEAGDCCAKDVVYSIQCRLCYAKYIGETGRFLHERLHEHILSMSDPFAGLHLNNPMAKHVMKHHHGQDVDVRIRV
ncbi:hypothetical protein AB6A40_005238 [Gnathostoma spinigerum]|uniref:C2H2-type domain-containing protein n=1 Tax=Gnathostoma spinigerum TaxID=75299 RepID=A0ABD6EMI3_9BILA